jgi:hypothetical protein
MQKAVELARHWIRANGYMPAIKIATELAKQRAFIPLGSKKSEIEEITDIGAFCDAIPCADIHRVEYTNISVAEYRVKDLFYYNPHTNFAHPKETARAHKDY